MKLMLIAAAALALSVGAHADATFDLGTVAGTLPVGDTVFAGSFADTYNFNVASLSSVTAVVLNTSYLIESSGLSLGKIGLFAASLDGIPLTLSVATTSLSPGIDTIVQKLFVNSPIPMFAGAHSLTIGGVGDAFSSAYTGSLTVTAVPVPVTVAPEPETYVLFLAGLGAIGLAKRRRNA